MRFYLCWLRLWGVVALLVVCLVVLPLIFTRRGRG
jgi:hypothetical protein